jgi:hypothetical protein
VYAEEARKMILKTVFQVESVNDQKRSVRVLVYVLWGRDLKEGIYPDTV